MTFQDVLDLISDNIVDNTNREITPQVDRTVRNGIVQWVEDEKVQKVAGKGLSDENYTTSEKNKLAGIEAGAEVNEVSAADLANKISKNFGIELRQNKGNFQAQSIVSSWNDIVGTGFYEGSYAAVSDGPPFSNQNGLYVIHQKLGGGETVNNAIQIAISIDAEEMAFRAKNNGVWGNWKMILTTTDKTELIDKINKLSIENIDLTEAGIWNASTKTLDLSSKIGVGILNFDTPAPTYTITDISVSNQATVSFDVDDSFGLIQEDSVVNFDSILGDPVFTQLNSGDYIARNVNYANRTFDIRKGDNSGWVDTSFSPIVDITNITSAAQAVVTVVDGNLLSENQIIEIKGAIGMELLEGLEFKVQNLDPVLGTFDLVDSQTGMGVDTQAMNYVSGGKVGNTPTFFQSGNATLKDDIVNVKIDKITGIGNGTRLKFTANEGNEVEFVKKPLASAVTDNIVGSEALFLEENKIFELLRNKNLNWIKSEFEAS